MNKKIGKLNNQKTTNYENININKLKNKNIKFRKDNIFNNNIFSPVDNIHIKKNKDVSASNNKIFTNIDGENVCDSETILKDVNNDEDYFENKKLKIKPFQNQKK